ncbi:MAG: metallophosphoesterase family protein [Candidatus Hydrogenedentes bacterium]|nr:metallophosphoesterase family protein [Candidatus Hydrogenedentota bacterium]
MVIGVISDTHGLLRNSALAYLAGVDLIIHAGDMGSESVLAQLREIAPVHAVLGNVDHGAWTRDYPADTLVQAGGKNIYVLHDRGELDLDPRAAGIDVVIFGHSHMVFQEVVDGVLYFNPGSAGPRRFQLPITAGKIILDGAGMEVEVRELEE